MFQSENYQKVKADMENRRISAQAEAERRNAEVRAESQEIRTIDEELTKTGLMLFRTACLGEDITALRERNQQLCQRRKQLLVSIGLPEDYTDVHYDCPLCSDTGYVGTAMCQCLRRALIRENIRSSGIGELIEQQTFENFDTGSYKADGEDVYRRMCVTFSKVKAYAENFAKTRGNLLLIGPTGTGKTHLSTAIAKRVIEDGYIVLYDSAQNIMNAYENDRFKSGYGPTERQSKKYTECDLLILDDLGTELVNTFTVSCLYNLINERQNKGRATVISTNLSWQEMTGRYEDRIYSRIIGSGYTVLNFCGHDHRLGK